MTGGTVRGRLVTRKGSGAGLQMARRKHILGPIGFSLELESGPKHKKTKSHWHLLAPAAEAAMAAF